jgi:hypothetical protein
MRPHGPSFRLSSSDSRASKNIQPGLAVNMDGDHSGDRSPRFPVVRPTGFAIQIAFLLEVFLQLLWIHAIRAFFDIDEIRPGTRLANPLRGGDKRVGDGQNNIARLNAGCHECKSNSIGAARESHAVRRSREMSEFAFEFLDHRAANKSRGPQHLLKNRDQFCLQLFVQTHQVQKGNSFVVCNHAILGSSLT